MQSPLHQHLPESEGQVIIIPSQGDTIGGIAYHYKEFYPPELEPYIEFDDYQKVMTDINETVKSYWPCFFTVCMGYVLCPVTLGLSLLLPRICIKDAEEEIRRIVEAANADYFHRKGAQLEFRKETFKSWDDANSSDKITKPASFTTDQKIRCAQSIFKARGYQGLFDKWEFYVIPFTTSRIAEGIIYFAVMRFLMDIIGLSDVFYIITAIAIFLCDIIGAFAFKLTADLMTTQEARDLKVYLDPKNRHFWKQYEIDHAFYQVYGYFQSYAQLITYWYFEPSIILEIVLYAISRIVGVVSSAPVGAISRFAKEFNYDYMKTLDFLMKKFGPLGLFAGAKDSCIIEVILSFIQVPIDIITKAIF